MLKRLSEKEQISILLDTYSVAIRQAFLDAIADIRSRITLGLIVERLERGDIAGAIDALNIEGAAFSELAMQVQQAFNAGGVAIVSGMPQVRFPDGHRAVLRFDVRDPEAEAWVRNHSATLVRGLTQEALASSRTTIETGMAEGRGPRSIATDLAGKKNRITGKREGGSIGLTEAQARQLANARSQLLSGDPAQLRAFMERNLRDKRFDRTIEKAIRESKALDKATADRMLTALSNRMLKFRADVIARTETMEAIEASRHEGYRQTMARLGLNAGTDIEKEWIATSGDRTRDTHQALHGQKVQGLETPFRSFSGALMRFPGDRTLGAPGSELINCRCHPIYRLRFERATR
jgi:hypothetical protein